MVCEHLLPCMNSESKLNCNCDHDASRNHWTARHIPSFFVLSLLCPPKLNEYITLLVYGVVDEYTTCDAQVETQTWEQIIAFQP